jgi:hypothetical protein
VKEVLSKLSDWHLEVLYRIAKRKLRPFFADPRVMRDLREERDRRLAERKDLH